jgi:hypothetical protein
MVDFGYTRSIGGGMIWGRTPSGCGEVCFARLTGFEIWVGSSSSAYNALGNAKCFTATTTEETQAPYTHAFDCAANGRYLFVVLTTGECLSMREIEVYSMGEEQYIVFVPKFAARDLLDKIKAGLERKKVSKIGLWMLDLLHISLVQCCSLDGLSINSRAMLSTTLEICVRSDARFCPSLSPPESSEVSVIMILPRSTGLALS